MKYNKEQVIDKGIELMRNSGYHAVGVREIVTACGMPKGSFYNFFESKEQFTSMAIDTYHEIAMKQIRSDLAGGGSSYRKIEKHFNNLITYYREKQCTQGCFFVNLSSEIGATSKALGQKIEKKYQEWMQLLAAEIQQGQDKGEIIASIHAIDLANSLYNSFNGAVTRMKIQESAKPMEDFLAINLALIKT